MIYLPRSRDAWNTPEFETVLKREVERLGTRQLPLQQALASSSYALDDAFSVMVIDFAGAANSIHARIGVFYSGIIAGCSCPDDPTPVEAQSEYCELTLAIDKKTAAASVTLPADAGRDTIR